ALLTARLRLPGGVATLEPLLRDRDVDVRHAALGGLTLVASDDAARALVRALAAGVLSADRIVERLGAPWGVPTLLDSLEDFHFSAVRGHLAEALGLARDPRGREPLEELLAQGSDDERTRACRALGRLGRGDAEASHDLLTALADPFWPVRAQAAKSLGEIGDPGAATFIERGLVDPAWWVRANCATALRALGEPGLEALRRALHHPDRFASDRAAEALSLEAAGSSPWLPRAGVASR
nr:HEAT repeat domain-containing protein [Thermoleophilaceae bacterium]